MDAHFDTKRFPAAALDYLQKQNVQSPLLSPDDWGGYLIYRLYVYPDPDPGIKVVIDDRHDFYGEDFLKSYLKMMHAEPGWEEFLEHHPSRVIVPKDSTLANLLGVTAGWQRVYSDDVAVVFVQTPAKRE